MTPTALIFTILAVAAGALFPTQTAINAKLAAGVGGPIASTLISFVAGLTALVVIVIVTRQVPTLESLRALPPWLLVSGGFLGATYLSLNVFLVPRIGAGAMMALAIAGQMVAALVIDRSGLFGVTVRELSASRILGAILVAIGAFMVRFL